MKLISNSYDTGFPPGCIYEVSHELGTAHLISKIASKLIAVEGENLESVHAVELREKIQGPDLPVWDRQLTPAAYLERYPNAPLAEVAKLYVKAGLGDVKGG